MNEVIRILTEARDALWSLSDEIHADDHTRGLDVETQGILLDEQIVALLGAVAA